MNRMIAVDFLKTISIFGVVFIHSRNGNYISEYISEIFRISVPVFIILFSYFLEKSLSNVTTKMKYFNILKHRFYKLFISYAFFTILYFFILNDVSKITAHDLITGYWSGYGWSGQYFFIILFQLLLVFPLIQKIANVRFSYITFFFIISILFYAVMTYYLWSNSLIGMVSDRLFIYWVPYAVLGILLFRKPSYFEKIKSKYALVLSVFLIPLEFSILDRYTLVHSPYVIISVLVASSLLAIFFIVHNNAITDFLPESIKKFSEYISARTLGIFVLNPLVVFLFKTNFDFQSKNVYIESFLVLLFAIFVFIVTILFTEIFGKTFLKRVVSN